MNIRENRNKINSNSNLMHVNSSKSTYNYRWWTVCSVYLHMTSSTAKTNRLARARLPIKMRMHWKKKHNDEPWSACNRCATKINRLKNTDTVHIQIVSNQRIELKPYYMCKSETPQIKRKQRVLCFVSKQNQSGNRRGKKRTWCWSKSSENDARKLAELYER